MTRNVEMRRMKATVGRWGKAGIAFAAGIAVPGWANAHGGEALIVGFLLPSAVVPAVLLSWLLATAVLGVRVRSRSRTALAVLGAAVAGVAFDYGLVLLRLGENWDAVLNVLWWGAPIALPLAAWLLIVRRH